MQHAQPPALSLRNVFKSYGDTNALNNLSLTVLPGQFYGFLGPNGAGKSTTIHLITGIARMQSGSIEVFGTDIEKGYRAARSHVGLSPQEFNVDIFEKTYALLDFVAGYYGLTRTRRKERIDALLEQFDLKQHAHKEFRELSGGLKRRVMLARAMVHDPELLILDEPTAGVDVELRRELWDYLRKLNEAGKTILLTSHYLEEVELLCDHIALINHGTVMTAGSKQDFMKEGMSLEDRYLELTKHD